MGWIASLPGADRAALLDRIRSLLPAPEYRRRWETHLHWAQLG
jgi:anion-transporting  ArsA/GET3 family ATPase